MILPSWVFDPRWIRHCYVTCDDRKVWRAIINGQCVALYTAVHPIPFIVMCAVFDVAELLGCLCFDLKLLVHVLTYRVLIALAKAHCWRSMLFFWDGCQCGNICWQSVCPNIAGVLVFGSWLTHNQNETITGAAISTGWWVSLMISVTISVTCVPIDPT